MSTLSSHAPCVQLSQAGDGTSFLWAPAEPRALHLYRVALETVSHHWTKSMLYQEWSNISGWRSPLESFLSDAKSLICPLLPKTSLVLGNEKKNLN